jgi:uncharacterized membrane protein YraQ (UPF0718 family)
MGDVTTFVLYGLALSWLAFSFARDRKKAEQALRKAWKSFANILPAFLVVLLVLALVVVLLPEATIAAFLGEKKWFFGVSPCLCRWSGYPCSWFCRFSHGKGAP